MSLPSIPSNLVECADLQSATSERKARVHKDKLHKKTALERVFGNKDVVKNHYFSAGTKIDYKNQRNLLDEPSPFIYPKDLEELSYKVLSKEWKEHLRQKELKYKYYQRNNYKSRQQLDTLNRLFVEEPQHQSLKTILDVDPQFFTIVEGRPVKTKKFNIKNYINQVRLVLQTKIVTGFRDDEVMLITEHFLQEQKMINRIKQQLEIYVDSFEEFIYNDHTTAMELLKEADRETNLSFAKYDEYREMSLDFGSLKSQVYNLEEKWRNIKMYQKFLYTVSPITWREEYDYYNFRGGKPIATESNVFGRYKLMESNVSLDDLISMFKEDLRTQQDPQLFFTDPHELLNVFRFIELQNLNSLLHIEELAIPIENIKIGMQAARLKFDAEINYLQDVINSLEGDIIWEEKRATALQSLAMELINGEFQNLIAAEAVLNLYVFVEDVYEKRVAPNDANLSISDMMKGIEIAYRNCLLELDYLPEERVHKAEMDCYVEEARVMKIAQEAAKKVVQIERQAKRLSRVLEPPSYRQTRALIWRSPPTDVTQHLKVEIKPLTEAETEYLELFTDFCKYTDKPGDYIKDNRSTETKQSVNFLNPAPFPTSQTFPS